MSKNLTVPSYIAEDGTDVPAKRWYKHRLNGTIKDEKNESWQVNLYIWNNDATPYTKFPDGSDLVSMICNGYVLQPSNSTTTWFPIIGFTNGSGYYDFGITFADNQGVKRGYVDEFVKDYVQAL